jgi:hypothetical protein
VARFHPIIDSAMNLKLFPEFYFSEIFVRAEVLFALKMRRAGRDRFCRFCGLIGE